MFHATWLERRMKVFKGNSSTIPLAHILGKSKCYISLLIEAKNVKRRQLHVASLDIQTMINRVGSMGSSVGLRCYCWRSYSRTATRLGNALRFPGVAMMSGVLMLVLGWGCILPCFLFICPPLIHCSVISIWSSFCGSRPNGFHHCGGVGLISWISSLGSPCPLILKKHVHLANTQESCIHVQVEESCKNVEACTFLLLTTLFLLATMFFQLKKL